MTSPFKMIRTYGSKRACYFCKRKIEEIDFKDAEALRRYLTYWSKIKSSKETGCCSHHQRRLSSAIKRARYFALLPYTTR